MDRPQTWREYSGLSARAWDHVSALRAAGDDDRADAFAATITRRAAGLLTITHADGATFTAGRRVHADYAAKLARPRDGRWRTGAGTIVDTSVPGWSNIDAAERKAAGR